MDEWKTKEFLTLEEYMIIRRQIEDRYAAFIEEEKKEIEREVKEEMHVNEPFDVVREELKNALRDGHFMKYKTTIPHKFDVERNHHELTNKFKNALIYRDYSEKIQEKIDQRIHSRLFRVKGDLKRELDQLFEKVDINPKKEKRSSNFPDDPYKEIEDELHKERKKRLKTSS